MTDIWLGVTGGLCTVCTVGLPMVAKVAKAAKMARPVCLATLRWHVPGARLCTLEGGPIPVPLDSAQWALVVRPRVTF